jgi:hypothetical protein
MSEKPKKLVEIESGTYKKVVVTGRLTPYTYKIMRTHMMELGIYKESDYIAMSITLMNQNKSGNKG